MLLTAAQQATLATTLHTDPNNIGFAPNISSGNEGQLLSQVNQIVPGSSVSNTFITKNNMILGTLQIGILCQQGVGAIGADGKTPLTAIQVARWTSLLKSFYSLDPGTQILFSVYNNLSPVPNPVADNVLTAAQAQVLEMGPGTTLQILFGQSAQCDITDIAACLSVLQAQGIQI